MNIDPQAGLSSASNATSYVAVSAGDETARELNKTYLKLLADSEQYLWLNHESRADGFNYPVDDLLAVTAMQARGVEAIATLPVENPIAQALADSIEKNAETLNNIKSLTVGGVNTYKLMVDKMLASFEGKTLSGIDLENLYVVALLDVAPYLTNSDAALQPLVATLLELLGSGNHNSSQQSPALILSAVTASWGILSSVAVAAPFGTDSVLYKAMTMLNGGTPPTTTPPRDLLLQIMRYDDVNAGGWLTPGQDAFSPTVRMYLIRSLMSDQAITTANIDTIVSGTKTEINQLFMEKTGVDAMTFLARDGKWQVVNIPSTQAPAGITQIIDFNGAFTATDATDLATTFPGRELTKEDLTQINNIGDQVKMLMQTLKYWLTTVRDEQLSISRNIS